MRHWHYYMNDICLVRLIGDRNYCNAYHDRAISGKYQSTCITNVWSCQHYLQAKQDQWSRVQNSTYKWFAHANCADHKPSCICPIVSDMRVEEGWHKKNLPYVVRVRKFDTICKQLHQEWMNLMQKVADDAGCIHCLKGKRHHVCWADDMYMYAKPSCIAECCTAIAHSIGSCTSANKHADNYNQSAARNTKDKGRSHLFIFWSHISVKVVWVRDGVSASLEFANLEAIVAKLRETVPVICLILEQEDWKLARRRTAVRVWMLDSKPAYDLPLYH